jgi:hypothetical protein
MEGICRRLTETVFNSTTEGSTFSDTERKTVCKPSATASASSGMVTWLSWARTRSPNPDFGVEQENDKKAKENPINIPIKTKLKMRRLFDDNFSIIFIVTPYMFVYNINLQKS